MYLPKKRFSQIQKKTQMTKHRRKETGTQKEIQKEKETV